MAEKVLKRMTKILRGRGIDFAVSGFYVGPDAQKL